MSDPEHWNDLFGEMLAKLVAAVGWRIECHDQRAGTATSRASDGLAPEFLAGLEKAIRGSRKQVGPGNTTYDWCDATQGCDELSDRDLRIFSFRMELSPEQEVRTAILLDRRAIQESAFESEFDFLNYCRRMISCFTTGAEAMSHAEIFRQIAGSISLGGIVADRNGKLVMNIGGRDGEVPDCLKPLFESPESAKKLLRQVVLDEAQACNKGAGGATDRPVVEGLISTGGQDRSVLHVIPVRENKLGTQDGRVLFAVLEPVTARCPSSQSLKRVYSLTPAEARVVERLVRGLPIKEISRVLKLSDNTVRTYLKRSFEKVGVSSQQALIYEVCGMATEARSGHRGAAEATAAE